MVPEFHQIKSFDPHLDLWISCGLAMYPGTVPLPALVVTGNDIKFRGEKYTCKGASRHTERCTQMYPFSGFDYMSSFNQWQSCRPQLHGSRQYYQTWVQRGTSRIFPLIGTLYDTSLNNKHRLYGKFSDRLLTICKDFMVNSWVHKDPWQKINNSWSG